MSINSLQQSNINNTRGPDGRGLGEPNILNVHDQNYTTDIVFPAVANTSNFTHLDGCLSVSSISDSLNNTLASNIPQLDGCLSISNISDSKDDSSVSSHTSITIHDDNDNNSYISDMWSQIAQSDKEVSSHSIKDSWYSQANETDSDTNNLKIISPVKISEDNINCQNIPLIIGNRPETISIKSPRKPARRTIQRDNYLVPPGVLPTLASYNMRSLFPKIKNLSTDLIERQIGLAFLSEIWEKEESKEHQDKLEEMFELKGLAYISNPRKVKRGGGAAIIANTRFCTIQKLPIFPPKPLEVVWGLAKPTSPLAKFKQIISVSFYAPPKTK